MADTDGYYFTAAERTIINPDTEIATTEGKNAVLWYKNFKTGGKNDNEIPDDNVSMNVIYPQGDTPPQNDPAELDDRHDNHSKQLLFLSVFRESFHSTKDIC